jgi:hypothetical protein
MWRRKRKAAEEAESAAPPTALKQAVRQARIETAERTGVVVDLRDAELARLELLNEALDPVFSEIPPDVDLFDRGISQGDQPRLWIDVVAHVVMGRDKREYRFVQDTRYGRKVLADSPDITKIVEAITHYVANRLVERARALSEDSAVQAVELRDDMRFVLHHRRRRFWRLLRTFLFGLLIGFAAVFAVLWVVASQVPK